MDVQAFIDYKNGIIPQIQIKYSRGDKTGIHLATERWQGHIDTEDGKTRIENIDTAKLSPAEGLIVMYNKIYNDTMNCLVLHPVHYHQCWYTIIKNI